MDTIREATRKAHKEHRCDLCHDTVEPGDTYRTAFIVEDSKDHFWTWKEHLGCAALALGWTFRDTYNRETWEQAMWDCSEEEIRKFTESCPPKDKDRLIAFKRYRYSK